MKKKSFLNGFYGLCLLSIGLTSCGLSKDFKGSPSIHRKVKKSIVFKEGFTGFALYHPKKEKWLYRFREKKRFIPASNAKILTLYTCLEVLGDSIPALRYLLKGDSLVFEGTGDPSFLNPRFDGESKVMDFFKKTDKDLYFSSRNFKDQKYGAGWAWDDAAYSYQTEKSPFPIYRNVARFSRDSLSVKWQISPPYFRKNTKVKPYFGQWVSRDKGGNRFYLKSLADTLIQYERDHPFIYSERLFLDLMEEAIGKKVKATKARLVGNTQTIYSIPSDTLYKQMMLPSDNFLAEQLLLLAASEIGQSLNTAKTIRYALDSLLQNIPDNPRWVDGSGLSRYNLISPRAQIWVLEKMLEKQGLERLKRIFPEGGQTGTIQKWYAGTPSYIFAKTGTMSAVHTLSGFLLSRKGEVLIFSFMHNNYRTSSKPYKEEMQRILEYVRDKY